jgi:uncharacterized protein (DUF427 family)
LLFYLRHCQHLSAWQKINAKTTMKAVWNNQIIAESDQTIVIENNHYFPKDSVKAEYLEPTDIHTTCAWKGVASYFSLVVDGKENQDAAWYYPNPKPAAAEIKDYIAFWKGVKVTE